jgi:hypothetical protein
MVKIHFPILRGKCGYWVLEVRSFKLSIIYVILNSRSFITFSALRIKLTFSTLESGLHYQKDWFCIGINSKVWQICMKRGMFSLWSTWIESVSSAHAVSARITYSPYINQYLHVRPIIFNNTTLRNLHIKAMLHGAIFLATCNAILLLRDVN